MVADADLLLTAVRRIYRELNPDTSAHEAAGTVTCARTSGCAARCLRIMSSSSASGQGGQDRCGWPNETGSANVAEIHNQALMMLAHEISDSETNRRVLVDHAFIVAGGTITKAARNWLGNALDARKRSQIMFMDRDDILNLDVV